MRRCGAAVVAAAALLQCVVRISGLSAPPAPPPDKPRPNPDEPRAPRGRDRAFRSWESWDSAVNVAFRPWDDAAQLLTSVERRRAFDPKPRRQDVEGGRWWTRLSQTIFPVERADDGLLVGDTSVMRPRAPPSTPPARSVVTTKTRRSWREQRSSALAPAP